MKYFVCFGFCHENGEKDYGNTVVEIEGRVKDYKDIRALESKVEEECGIEHPVVFNYKPIGESIFGYERIGDAEWFCASGENISINPQVSIGASPEVLGKFAKDVAETLKKLLVTVSSGEK